MKLLIVEDQPKTGHYLRQGLAEAGFTTELVADGTNGQHLALTGDYDLLILDVRLPGRNGWQILQAVRSAGLDVPVLFLTARDAVEDRVHGLEDLPTIAAGQHHIEDQQVVVAGQRQVLAAGAVGHQFSGKAGLGQALAQVLAGFGLVFDDQQFHGQLLAAGHVRLYTVVARGGAQPDKVVI